tara:strand:- start:1200 stop:1529 length:330 start_codon:yes stop_codon:yes gene_type:complete
MEKFLKITFGSEPTLIPISNIAGITRGAAGKVNVLLNTVSLSAAAGEVLAFEITASGAGDDPKTRVQLTSLAALIEEALTTSWTNPVMDITTRLPYAVTGILRKHFVWE